MRPRTVFLLGATVAIGWLGAGAERCSREQARAPAPGERAATVPSAGVVREGAGPRLEGSERMSPREGAVAEVIVGAARPTQALPSPSGATEVAGVVIDERGRAGPAGRVRATRLLFSAPGPGATLVAAAVLEGRFVLTLPAEGPNDVLLEFVSDDGTAWASARVTAVPGRRLEGVELLRVLGVRVLLQVLDAAGAPAPAAVAELGRGGDRGVEPVPLDAEGRGSVIVPADGSCTLRARSADGRWFAASHALGLPGAQGPLLLRLEGPWERARVRVVSQRADRSAPARASVTVERRPAVEAQVDGEPVDVWVPPPGRAFVLRALSWDLDAGASEHVPDDASRARLLEGGCVLDLGAELRSPLPLEVVDAAGDPLPHLDLYASGESSPSPQWCGTDAHGRAALRYRRVGDVLLLRTSAGGPERARFTVPAGSAPLRVSLAGVWSRVGGFVRGDWAEALPPPVALELAEGHASGRVDVRTRRWEATLLVPEGTPVRARVPSATVVPTAVEGRTGRLDLDVEARLGALELAPRLGPLLRPRGRLVLEPVERAPGAPPRRATQEIDPRHEPWVLFVGLEPGGWRLGFQPENGPVRWHPAPVEIVEGFQRVEPDFGPP